MADELLWVLKRAEIGVLLMRISISHSSSASERRRSS